MQHRKFAQSHGRQQRFLRGQGAFALWLRNHTRWALLLMLLLSGILGPLSQNAALLAFFAPTASAHPRAAQGKPTHADPHAGATSIIHLPQRPALHVNRPDGPPAPISRPTGATMAQGLLPLRPDAPATFLGSDGRLEIDVPDGAITAADQTAVGGRLQLAIRQIAGGSGSSAGGSGLVSFGTYLLQVVDGNGVLTSQGLRKPIIFKLHLPKAASALDLTRAFVVVNGPLPVGVTGAPTALVIPDIRSEGAATPAVPNLGKYSHQRAAYDPGQQTLSATISLNTASTSGGFDTDSAVASFGHPDPFNTDLSGGGLTTSIPLDVPAGPVA